MNTDTSLYYQENTSTSSYSYYEPISNEKEQRDCDMEDACYAQYDLEVANAVAEADYQDYYYEQQQQQLQQSQQVEEEYFDEEEEKEDDDEDEYYSNQKPQQTYDYQHDSLLSLVVGVQSYLTEQEQSNNDSPLYSLQYKMYTYLRQKALELGVQL
jgi:TATA-binding protein-associated factor Taf7